MSSHDAASISARRDGAGRFGNVGDARAHPVCVCSGASAVAAVHAPAHEDLGFLGDDEDEEDDGYVTDISDLIDDGDEDGTEDGQDDDDGEPDYDFTDSEDDDEEYNVPDTDDSSVDDDFKTRPPSATFAPASILQSLPERGQHGA